MAGSRTAVHVLWSRVRTFKKVILFGFGAHALLAAAVFFGAAGPPAHGGPLWGVVCRWRMQGPGPSCWPRFNQIDKKRGKGGVLGSTDMSFLLLGDGDLGESCEVCVALSRAVIFMH